MKFNNDNNQFLAEILDLEQEARLSQLFDVSGVQESFRFRALHRARRIALALIDDRGEVRQDLLKKLIVALEKEGYIFYPGGYNDGTITEHILPFLRLLAQDETLKSLKRFQRPLCHKWAEQIVSETLGMPALTDAHIRAAVLCACLTPLRQNVGSCFATAPAILIQREQVSLLIDDLYQLLSTGKLKRTFGGVEYAVPMSPSTGIGDLNKKLLSPQAMLCPGLIAAIRTITDEEVQVPIGMTAADLIHQVLLRQFSVSDTELQKARSLEIAEFKAGKLSPKMEQVRALQQKRKRGKVSVQSRLRQLLAQMLGVHPRLLFGDKNGVFPVEPLFELRASSRRVRRHWANHLPKDRREDQRVQPEDRRVSKAIRDRLRSGPRCGNPFAQSFV